MQNQYEDNRQVDAGCEPGFDSSTNLQDQISGNVSEMKEKVSDAGRRAAARIDAQREPTARTLESTAQSVRDGGARITDATDKATRTTADKLQSAADYIRTNNMQDMMGDVQDAVREHPGPALAVAAIAGFLIGKAISGSRG